MDFSSQINAFVQTGSYTYQIDDGGNLFLNQNSSEFNQHYIAIPIVNTSYNTKTINQFYPIAFTEFISTNIIQSTASISDLQSQLADALTINQTLSQTLESTIALQESNSNSADMIANRQVIVGLRISLKQGVSPNDFSNTFPYLPVKS